MSTMTPEDVQRYLSLYVMGKLRYDVGAEPPFRVVLVPAYRDGYCAVEFRIHDLRYRQELELEPECDFQFIADDWFRKLNFEMFNFLMDRSRVYGELADRMWRARQGGEL